jgi:hypothetical protein
MHAIGEYTIADLMEAFSDARGQPPQQPGDRQQDSDRGEVDEKRIRREDCAEPAAVPGAYESLRSQA